MVETKLVKVDIDKSSLAPADETQENERKVAIFDLLEENHFAPVVPEGYVAKGPFELKLLADESRLVFDITDQGTNQSAQHILSISPFRQVLKDYFEICKAYYQAVKDLPPSQLEAIDMGRRGIHNEGARILEERLAGKVEIDNDTARRLFTLISAMLGRVYEDRRDFFGSFSCDHNAVRSPMAEGIMKKLYARLFMCSLLVSKMTLKLMDLPLPFAEKLM